MKTGALGSGMKLNGAAVLIALLAFSSFAQQAPQRFEPTSNASDLNIVDASPESVADRASSYSKAKVDWFRSLARPVRSKCELSSFASPRLKPNTQTMDQFHGGELFSFDSRAAKPCAESATRSSGELAERAEGAQAQGPQGGATDAQELAKKLSNPVAALISFPMQSNFDFRMGTGSGWRYTLNVQPVIPIALGPKWNMISRTIIPIIHQGNVTGPNTSQSGLGDTVQSLFFSPNKSEPFVWGVGPVVLIPTATDASLGAQKWGIGPTALALKQKKGWTVLVLASHLVRCREVNSWRSERYLRSAGSVIYQQTSMDLQHKHGIDLRLD